MYRTDEQHPASCLSCMAALRKEGKLCDVVIQVQSASFNAHRVVLASSSPYFEAMFGGELEESRQSTVTIKDISASVMEQLLDYCYTSSIAINEDTVQDLLTASGILQLSWVQEVCCEFMKHQLDYTNCLGIQTFADAHNCRELHDAASCYALQRYLEVVDGMEFLELNCEELIKLLQNEDLNVQSEEQVYESALKWVKYEEDQRKHLLPAILEHVRLPLLERSFLVSVVGTEPLIKHNEKCRDLLDEAKDYLLLPEKRSLVQGPRTTPRRPMRSEEMMFALGGWCSGDAISLVECFNSQTEEWKVMATMSKRRCGVGVGVLQDLLYAIGGHDGSSYLNSVERYDPKTNQWSNNVAPTSSSRTSVGVGVGTLDGYMYAIGGQDGVSCLSIVERYEPRSNQWTAVCSLANKRLGMGVAVLEGYVYAIGGSDGALPLDSVERYDPKLDQWIAVAPLMNRRKHLGVAVLDGMIYAVGGRDQRSELSSVERYDPSTNTWSSVVAMNTRRSGVGVCVVNGRLYAVGGFDGVRYLKSIEWFDNSSNEWKFAPQMNYRRLGCGVGVVKVTCTNPNISTY